VKVTGDVASGVAGVKEKLTVGVAATVIVWLELAVRPLASVAMTLTVNEPEEE